MSRWMRYAPYLRPVVRISLLFFLLLAFSACAPAISKQVRQQADQSLSFPVLSVDPDVYKGKVVVLGGVIAKITTKPEQTELEIVQKNLDSSNEPETTDTSYGRFLVIADRFLDPLIYKKDRKITIAGEVLGSEVRKLDTLEYRYPVIKALELKLWPPPGSRTAPFFMGLGVGYSFGGPYGYWGWGPGLYYLP